MLAHREYSSSSLSGVSSESFVEVNEASEIVYVDVHELLLGHAKVSVRLTHFTQQIFYRGRDFVFRWHVEGHSSHFFDEFLLSSTLPGRQSNHQFIEYHTYCKYVALC